MKIRGPLFEIETYTQALRDGGWTAQVLLRWENGDSTYERKMFPDGIYTSEADAQAVADEFGRCWASVTEAPLDWYKPPK